MAEWPRPQWTSYHNTHPNNCQDLGNSILLLLGLVICVNISINMVTLLWHKLRGVLNQVFHIICEKEVKACSPEEKNQSPKKSLPEVHLRCTMDPVQMTVTPPPTQRHPRHPDSSLPFTYHSKTQVPDTEEDEEEVEEEAEEEEEEEVEEEEEEEKPSHMHPAFYSHDWNGPQTWGGYQTAKEFWVPWDPDAANLSPQTLHFQETIVERSPQIDRQSDLGLQAYVYPVNPPPPSPRGLSHSNNGGGPRERAGRGAEVEQEPSMPAPPDPPPIQGPAYVPEIPRCRSTARIEYDARDVRRRLRELSREVEAITHCYPLASKSSTAKSMAKNGHTTP